MSTKFCITSNPEELHPINDILSSWFDNYKTLEEKLVELKSYITKNQISISSKKIDELSHLISNLESENSVTGQYNWEEVEYFPVATELTGDFITYLNNDDYRKISHSLFVKFSNIFHQLIPNKEITEVSEIINANVIRILQNNYSTVYVRSQKSAFSIFQTIHGDLSISKYSQSNQSDLFYSDKHNYEVSELGDPDEYIHIYQHPSALYGKLLEFCKVYNYYPKEIDTLFEIQSNIPNTTDANDISSYTINNFENNLMNSENMYSIVPEGISQVLKIELDSKNQVISISNNWILKMQLTKEDIWPLLIWLLKNPWRSNMEMRKMIEIFQEKSLKIHQKEKNC